MSDILTQDDYKRFEELLEQMIKEADRKRWNSFNNFDRVTYAGQESSLRVTLQLIKERQNLTLNKKE